MGGSRCQMGTLEAPAPEFQRFLEIQIPDPTPLSTPIHKYSDVCCGRFQAGAGPRKPSGPPRSEAAGACGFARNRHPIYEPEY